jgi:hypothetical protein
MSTMKSLSCLLALLVIAICISPASAVAKDASSVKQYEFRIVFAYSQNGAEVKKKAPTTNIAENESATFSLDENGETFDFTIEVAVQGGVLRALTTVKMSKGGATLGTAQIVERIGRGGSANLGGTAVSVKAAPAKKDE